MATRQGGRGWLMFFFSLTKGTGTSRRVLGELGRRNRLTDARVRVGTWRVGKARARYTSRRVGGARPKGTTHFGAEGRGMGAAGAARTCEGRQNAHTGEHADGEGDESVRAMHERVRHGGRPRVTRGGEMSVVAAAAVVRLRVGAWRLRRVTARLKRRQDTKEASDVSRVVRRCSDVLSF